MTLDTLPKELLFEIFDYVSITDLLSLAATCRTFSIFINNTRLVEKFTLNFDRSFASRDWIGSRKYTRLSIEVDTGAFGILRAIGEDLRRITVSAKSIDLKTLARILRLCPHVTHLKFIDVKTHSCLDLMSPAELPRHRDLRLWIENTTPNILELFKCVEVHSLTLLAPTSLSDFGICWNVDDCRVTFNNFMRSQKSLRKLDMRNFKANASIFGGRGLDDAPFRLEHLKLANFNISNANLHEFLARHRDTLVSVDVDGKSMTEEFALLLSQCPRLAKFKFMGTLRTHKRVLRSVRSLSAHIMYAQVNWTSMFPGVEELQISSSCENVFDGLKSLQNLKKLTIYDSHFFEERALNIPSVRTLTLRDIMCERARIFAKCPKHLETLTLESMSAEVLVEFLTLHGVQLTSLVVKNPRRMNVYRERLHFDPQRVKNVKILEYENFERFKDDDSDERVEELEFA